MSAAAAADARRKGNRNTTSTGSDLFRKLDDRGFTSEPRPHGSVIAVTDIASLQLRWMSKIEELSLRIRSVHLTAFNTQYGYWHRCSVAEYNSSVMFTW